MRTWWSVLAALVGVRLAIPLAAYAGARLPDTPRWRDEGLTGDATGFYAATREFIAAWGRVPRPVLAIVAIVAIAAFAWIAREWRRRPERRQWLLAAAALVFGLLVSVDVAYQHPSGAAVFGWPLVWALPMLVYRVLGLALDQHVAFFFGFALSLVFVGATVVATAYAGAYATGRRALGLLAGAFFAVWPLLTGAIAGHSAWANGSWAIDAGLHNYTEPLSTLLVTAALALLLSPEPTELRLALCGVALSLATLTKVSNALLAAAALVLLTWRLGARRTLPYVAGALSLAPLVLAYWPKSYPKLFGNPQSWPRDPFDPAHVVTSWTDSLLFTPRTLLIVVPLALVGALALRRPWPLAPLLAWLLVNPLFYSFYANTAQHPRFLYASLPPLFVLWAAGAGALVRRVPQLRPVRA